MSTDTSRRAHFESVTDQLTDLNWPGIALTGAGAYIAGYLLTVLVVVVGPADVSGGVKGILLLIGFLFYSAHNVTLDIAVFGQLDWLSALASPTTPTPNTPVIVYYAVPIIVLLAAGVVVARQFTEQDGDPIETAATVVGMAVPYGLLMVVGTFVIKGTEVFGAPASLVLSDAALYGFAYPLAFGTIAAVITQLVAYVRRE